METWQIGILAFTAWLAACGGLGAYAARQKWRRPLEGAAFGLLLGPLGVLAVVLLPTLAPPPATIRPRNVKDSLARVKAAKYAPLTSR